MEWAGLLQYALSLLSLAGIYAILSLGLNIQWGFAGLFNAGIAGFFAIGAYTAAILTGPQSHYFLPFPLGLLSAAGLAALAAWPIGKICLRLKGDYLAMASIGIAEIIRLAIKNEEWLTNGTKGLAGIPRPFEEWGLILGNSAFLILILMILAGVYWLSHRLWQSPWGRSMRAIRDNEQAAAAIGKDVVTYRLEAFLIGAACMGLGGALSVYYLRFIGLNATEPLTTTFLVWVMLIIGGSGNNKGAVWGAFLIWIIWSATELITNRLPPEWITRSSYIRILLIGLLLQIILQRFARGLFPERPPKQIG